MLSDIAQTDLVLVATQNFILPPDQRFLMADD
jgi:hypothetical protein